MKPTSISAVNINSVKANPHRNINNYPFMEDKLKVLEQSIRSLGELWEGIIAREVGNHYEIAFGHHRLEAAKRAGLKKVDLIIRDLTDEQMLQFMGRENMEDYRSEFLIQLETWEAAVKFAGPARQKMQPVDIARVLGWTFLRDNSNRTKDEPNETALACSSAHTLIQGGWVKRNDFAGVSVKDACDICQQGRRRMEEVEQAARKEPQRFKPQQVQAAKAAIATGVKETARRLRDPQQRRQMGNLRGEVDAQTYIHAKGAKRKSPFFSAFLKHWCDSIDKVLSSDVNEEKFKEWLKAIPDLTEQADLDGVDRAKFSLKSLAERATTRREKIEAAEAKEPKVVTPEFRQISNG